MREYEKNWSYPRTLRYALRVGDLCFVYVVSTLAFVHVRWYMQRPLKMFYMVKINLGMRAHESYITSTIGM